jgi:hypothetical protein
MGPPPDEGGAGDSGTRRVGPGEHPRHMTVQDRAMGDREGGEGATATGGDRRGGGGRGEAAGTPLMVGLRRRWTTLVRMTILSPVLASVDTWTIHKNNII